MRVIAGTARSLPLRTVKSNDTRPTTDRIKETLFNMLNSYLYHCRFLDLFSGSGAIGIEALSRGASYAAFVESGKEQVDVIRYNLKFTKLEDRAKVCPSDVFRYLETGLPLEAEPFDVVFMDPPYDEGLEIRALEILGKSSKITKDTLVLFEASIKTDISMVESLGFSIIKQKKYKTNQHVWLKREG